MADKRAEADLRVGDIATHQHGAVTIRQLRSAGLSADAVLGRVRAGRLHRIHRGVYTVAHPALLSVEGRWITAVLACGEKSALSHRSAAGLWGMLPPEPGPVDVTVATQAGRRRREGIRVHRSLSLEAAAVTQRHRIRVTRPARTIEDLRRVISAPLLRRAIRQAAVLGLPVGEDIEPDRTRSELEYLFLNLCRRNSLPTPQVNARVGPHLVDFLWEEPRLIAETDGYKYHRGRAAFEDDRARDLDLRLQGYEVAHFTYRQVTNEPGRIATVLGAFFGIYPKKAPRRT